MVNNVSVCMDYAHKAGLFHYDMKPENILVNKNKNNNNEIVFKVSDIGKY